MANIPYTSTWPAGTTVTITADMRVKTISFKGNSATSSTLLSTLNPPTGFPAASTIALANGQIIGYNGGEGTIDYVQGLTVTVPAGGSIEVTAEIG